MGIGYLKRFFCRTNNITPMMFANFGFYMRIFVSRLSGNLRKDTHIKTKICKHHRGYIICPTKKSFEITNTH